MNHDKEKMSDKEFEDVLRLMLEERLDAKCVDIVEKHEGTYFFFENRKKPILIPNSSSGMD